LAAHFFLLLSLSLRLVQNLIRSIQYEPKNYWLIDVDTYAGGNVNKAYSILIT
jgi:hypothetical protein